MEFSSRYNFKEVEERWYSYWEEQGYFHARVDSPKPGFCIVIPPPNITGSLHVGHALNTTIQDILIRFRRLQGDEPLWVPGLDHAGIATQVMVERELLKEGKNRFELSREEFLARMWEWKERYSRIIVEQLKRLGCACDWARLRFTLDPGNCRAVREAFCRYYERGLVYHGDYLINFCPRCGTALSDLEVRYREEDGELYFISYPFEGGGGSITVATTRPETMLGDTAVAVHPEDERYKGSIGRRVILPLVGRTIPVIGDPAVEMGFGTGAVKVTPAHDPQDFEIGRRHDLERVKVIDEAGQITPLGTPRYQGLSREEARAKILSDLKGAGLLNRVEPYRHSIGRCARCDTVVEPLISKQWFLKMAPLVQPAIEAVESGRIRFTPERWAKVYLNWMRGLRDWCISRQLWWGHQIPAWYCSDCGAVLVRREAPVHCDCGSPNLSQDPDVLDTWFSSALWPFAALGWPDETPELRRFYPTQVLSTDPDIIFLWVARMVMTGLDLTGQIPFERVYIHSTVLSESGERMSRSRGVGVDPISLMHRFGADALRFTLAYLESGSQSFRLWEDRFLLGRNFANKLWNGARLVLPCLEGFEPEGMPKLEPVDDWLIANYDRVLEEVTRGLTNLEFARAVQSLYEFYWHQLCDWWLEFSKPRLYGQESAARWVAYQVFNGLLLLLHPFMPFITEELWHRFGYSPPSILLARWPEPIPVHSSAEVEGVEVLKGVIGSLRNLRSQFRIPHHRLVDCTLKVEDESLKELLSRYQEAIQRLARVGAIRFERRRPPNSVILLLPGVELYLELPGLLDREKELSRLYQESTRLEADLCQFKEQLENPNFLTRATPVAVERVRSRIAELSSKLERTRAAIAALKEG